MTAVTSHPAVVVPTEKDPAGYASVRSLSRRGIHTIVASSVRDPASVSRYCDEFVSVPSPSSDLIGYRDALLELAHRPEVQTILPVRPQDGFVLSKYQEEFEPYVTLVVPPFETLRTVHDRVALYDVASAAGIPAPATRPLSEGPEVDADAIVKSRYNILTHDYLPEIPPTEASVVKELFHQRAGDVVDVATVTERFGHDPIVQEYVHSSGKYMVGALFDHGEPVFNFQHRQIRGTSYTGGGGVYRESIADPELEAVSNDLLAALDYHGLACIEYLKDEVTGEYKFIEINPRLWQSLPSAVLVGADFPYYYWLLAVGDGDRIDPEYELGKGSHLLMGELSYLISVLRESSPHVDRPSMLQTMWDIGLSMVEMPYFDDFRVDDPRPFLQIFLNALKR